MGRPAKFDRTTGGNPGANPEDLAASVTAEALFFQSPGYMTIVHQSNNDVRIIPLDGRPPVPSSIRQWWGDARGRWEGNTLVVETTNFKNRAPAPNMYGSSDGLRVVERFTRIAPNTIRYEYTLTDPNTWTRPWSAEADLPLAVALLLGTPDDAPIALQWSAVPPGSFEPENQAVTFLRLLLSDAREAECPGERMTWRWSRVH